MLIVWDCILQILRKKGRAELMTEVIAFKLVSILCSGGFLLLACFSKKVIGVWLNPASIFSLFWFLYTALPFVIVFDAPINPFSVLYILCFNAAFVSSVVIFNWRTAFQRNSNKVSAVELFNTLLFRAMFYTFSFLAISFSLSGVFSQGFTVGDVFTNPMAVAGGYAKKRYSGEVVITLFSQIGLLSSYLTVVFGGLLYGSLRRGESKLVIVIMAFVPSLLVMILQSAKGLFFFSIFLFCGGILVARIYDKSYQLFTLKAARTLGSYAVIVFPVIVMSFLSRGLYGSADSAYVIFKLKRYLVTYSSGHIYAFSDWFSDRYFNYSVLSYDQNSMAAGFYTFMSFFRILGDDRVVPMGVYNQFYVYGDYIVTNLYTIFRGLIVDFGLLGSLVFAVVIGFINNFVYYRLLCSRENSAYIILLVFFIAMSYQTYIISTLMWVTIPVVVGVLILTLGFYFNIRKTKFG